MEMKKVEFWYGPKMYTKAIHIVWQVKFIAHIEHDLLLMI